MPLGPPDLNRYKELRGGIHITHPHHTDHRTLGAIVQDASAISSGRLLGLSCFHVVGDRESGAPVGVWQPTAPPFPSRTSPPDDRIERSIAGMFVSKRGAMTRLTHGMVASRKLITPWTWLGPDPKRYLVASIEIRVDTSQSPHGFFADVGDSGSVMMKRGQPTAVGLLWGGSDNRAWGAMTDIGIVEQALEISMVWG